MTSLRHAGRCWRISANLMALDQAVTRQPNAHRLAASVTQPPSTASSEYNIRHLREFLVMLRLIRLNDVAIDLQIAASSASTTLAGTLTSSDRSTRLRAAAMTGVDCAGIRRLRRH
ncbi:hypothetical protein [Stenotrophomonas sp.]|uniref:hypothetical protein n=1 Tax=Stenotrophomonas sp. TaxID=69392 RepID=UPI0028985A13|nr:hypothetical protein [Stenotrophomonas sp.]